MSAPAEAPNGPRLKRELASYQAGATRPPEKYERQPVEPRRVASPTRWRVADSALAVSLLAGLVVVTNLRHMPQGLEGFLAIRLSLKNVLLLTAFAWLWPMVLKFCGLYARNRLRTGQREWPRLICAGALGCVLTSIFPLLSRSGLVTLLHPILFGVCIVPLAGLLRISVRSVERSRQRARPRQIVLVGSGRLAARLYQELLSDSSQNIEIVGFVDSEPHPAMMDTGAAYLGGIQDLESVLMHLVVDDVLIGLPVKSRYDDIRHSLEACARVGVPASHLADLFGGRSIHPSPAGHIAAVLTLFEPPDPDLMALKRVIDVAGASILLILLSPVMLGIAVAIKLTSAGPVLFAQDRYGYMKRLFRMYKFRTMVADAELLHDGLEAHNEAAGPIFKIRDDPRVTPLGRFLRRSSLDELPQIWHVLTGKMSLVGPRPMATRDVGRFDEPWLMRRFCVRPGLTCLWQVRGRSNLSFARWIELDLEYIDRWSPLLDAKILLQTIPAVFRGRGAV